MTPTARPRRYRIRYEMEGMPDRWLALAKDASTSKRGMQLTENPKRALTATAEYAASTMRMNGRFYPGKFVMEPAD